MCIGTRQMTLAVLGAVSLAACHHTVKVDPVGAAYPARKAGCEITVLDQLPSAPYQLIGKIEAHAEGNFFFGGKVTLKDDVSKELRKKACLLGGDALYINDAIESSAAEMSYAHAWASVFRRQQ